MKAYSIVVLGLVAAAPAFAGDMPGGETLYVEHCLDCHGEDASGGDNSEPDIRGVNMVMLDRALSGMDAMPEFEFSDAEVTALHAYLQLLDS